MTKPIEDVVSLKPRDRPRICTHSIADEARRGLRIGARIQLAFGTTMIGGLVTAMLSIHTMIALVS